MKLPYFRAGSPPAKSAAVNNAIIAATRDSMLGDDLSPPRSLLPQDNGLVWVKNNSGIALDLFAVVGLTAPLFDVSATEAANISLRDEPAFGLTWPAATQKRWAILTEPLGVGSIGQARLAGLSLVAVEDTAVSGDLVDIGDRADENVLAVATDGAAQVLWTGPGIDLPANANLAFVRLGFGGGAGTSAGAVIHFEVYNWCPDINLGTGCECVYATVTRVSCGLGVQVGDSVFIWDPDLCWFNLPIDQLVGLRGTANYMQKPDPYLIGGAACPEATYDDGPCHWVVASLCCREEVYV